MQTDLDIHYLVKSCLHRIAVLKLMVIFVVKLLLAADL